MATTILVADDNRANRDALAFLLETAGYRILTAVDGRDALAQTRTERPELVISDVLMPRMDGYELATYMRNDARLKEVPIIMVTSRTGEKHRQRALEIGVERYLGKPYQEADLLRHVQEILRMDRA